MNFLQSFKGSIAQKFNIHHAEEQPILPVLVLVLFPTDVSAHITSSHEVSSYLAGEWLSMNCVTQFWSIGHKSVAEVGREGTSGEDFLTPKKRDKTSHHSLPFISSGH